jgi:hypothetical protein
MYANDEILFSCKKKGNSDTCYTVEELEDIYDT